MDDTGYLGVLFPSLRNGAPGVTHTDAMSVDEQTVGEHDRDMTDMPLDMVLGENDRPAFAATNSHALDFFFQVVPDIDRVDLVNLLEAAWEEHAVTTLRLIFHTGNVREGGKMDRLNFYQCLVWLWDKHPETLLLNLDKIEGHTCLKDLLQLLEFALHPTHLEGFINGTIQSVAHKAVIRSKKGKRARRLSRRDRRQSTKERFAKIHGKNLHDIWVDETAEASSARDTSSVEGGGAQYHHSASRPLRKIWVPEFKEVWDEFVKTEQFERVEFFKTEKKEKKAKNKEIIAESLLPTEETLTAKVTALRVADNGDGGTPVGTISPKKAALNTRLFDGIVEIFADGLRFEEEIQKTHPDKLGGLYGKWAPTRGGACDKATNIVETLCQKIWLEEPVEVTCDASTYWLVENGVDTRVRYDKLLSTLRGCAMVPEHFVGKAEWGAVDYDHMPSLCRLIYGEKVFKKHDKERYMKFLEDAKADALVKKSEDGVKAKTVKVGALLPHEVSEKGWRAFLKVNQGQREYDYEDSDEDDDGDAQEDDEIKKASIIAEAKETSQVCRTLIHKPTT
jgi:hypothetical protein